MPDAPSSASPTTWKPSVSSTRRAADLNGSWSSTIRTVVANVEIVPHPGRRRYRAAPEIAGLSRSG
jgi:hypothetical protein